MKRTALITGAAGGLGHPRRSRDYRQRSRARGGGASVPLARLGSPDELADLMAWLRWTAAVDPLVRHVFDRPARMLNRSGFAATAEFSGSLTLAAWTAAKGDKGRPARAAARAREARRSGFPSRRSRQFPDGWRSW